MKSIKLSKESRSNFGDQTLGMKQNRRRGHHHHHLVECMKERDFDRRKLSNLICFDFFFLRYFVIGREIWGLGFRVMENMERANWALRNLYFYF